MDDFGKVCLKKFVTFLELDCHKFIWFNKIETHKGGIK